MLTHRYQCCNFETDKNGNPAALLLKNYVNKEDFIEGVIESDGYGILSLYDGSVDEYRIMNQTYYVIRVN